MASKIFLQEQPFDAAEPYRDAEGNEWFLFPNEEGYYKSACIVCGSGNLGGGIDFFQRGDGSCVCNRERCVHVEPYTEPGDARPAFAGDPEDTDLGGLYDSFDAVSQAQALLDELVYCGLATKQTPLGTVMEILAARREKLENDWKRGIIDHDMTAHKAQGYRVIRFDEERGSWLEEE